jgi:hypothetical protein
MDLADKHKDLLRLLVSKHNASSGAEFILVHSFDGYGFVYTEGISLPIKCDQFDFCQLRQERLISFRPLARWSGRPTDLGITMVRRGFRGRRLMRDFETRCAVLAPAAQQKLEKEGDPIETQLSDLIEAAGLRIQERRAEIAALTDSSQCESAETALAEEIRGLRRGVIEAAENLANQSVLAFSNAILFSQGRLFAHAVWVRTYTAELIGAIRHWLAGFEVMKCEALPEWQQDSIAQEAIRACEEVLAERQKVEAGESPTANANGAMAEVSIQTSRTWSRIVQAWEALKSTRGIKTDNQERIPESDLRDIVGGEFSTKPLEVTEVQIELAAIDLCRHYGTVHVVPASVSGSGAPSPRPVVRNPIADATFWKHREREFRRHTRDGNQHLGATWFSQGSYWKFQTGSGSPPSPLAIDCFKSLAREAAKGLDSPRGADAWIDWLGLLRDARDEQTGKLLHARTWPGSFVISQRELARMTSLGDRVPVGAVIEFIGTQDGGVERRTDCESKTVIVEKIFANSANQCIRLRSLPPHPRPTQFPADTAFALNANEKLNTGHEDTPFQKSASRAEIEQYASEIFTARIEERIEEYARSRPVPLRKLRRREILGNISQL